MWKKKEPSGLALDSTTVANACAYDLDYEELVYIENLGILQIEQLFIFIKVLPYFYSERFYMSL